MAEDTARPEHRPRLGRGLAALLGDPGEEAAAVDRSRGVRKAPVEFLRPNPRNPRKSFADEDLNDLSASNSRTRRHSTNSRACNSEGGRRL